MFFLYVGIFILSSCATLFNSPTTKVAIHTNAPTKVTVEYSESKREPTNTPLQFKKVEMVTVNNKVELRPMRSVQPLRITVETDTFPNRELYISSQNSFAFWSNLAFFYGVGMLVDFKNPKRYSYPKHIYINSFEQGNTYWKFNYDHKSSKRALPKITPQKLVAFTNPGVEIALEIPTGEKFSTQIMGTFLFTKPLFNDDISPRAKGFRTAIEERYFLSSKTPFGSYIALELNYMKRDYNHSWSFIPKDEFIDSISFTNQNIQHETFRIHKQTFSIHAKIGYQFIRNHFVADTYFGIGPRYKIVKSSGKTSPSEVVQSHFKDYTPFDYHNRQGEYWMPSLTLNVRLGYRF